MHKDIEPLVSVVIPTYNHAQYLGRALQSVLDQTYSNWEAIVIDNYSQDNTDEVVQKFKNPRITLLKITNNGVIAASRNKGIQAAKGEWVAFLDSDDWWWPEKLKACFEYPVSQADLIYHELKIVREFAQFSQRKKIKSRRLKKPILIDLLVNGNLIPNSSVVVRKKLLIRIGGIDESAEMIAAEDYNTWLRISQITNKFYYINKTLGFYMEHSQSISKKDTTKSERYACAEFLHFLNKKQRIQNETNLKYNEGRFRIISKNYEEARRLFVFCLRHGSFYLKTKSLLMFMTTFIHYR